MWLTIVILCSRNSWTQRKPNLWLKFLRSNSPIHTLQKLFPFVGSTQRSKGEKTTFPFFIQSNIWASCEKIFWNLFNYSFNVWVAPTLGNQNSKRKRIFYVKWRSYNTLKYKGYCGKYTVFPQRWRPGLAYRKSEHFNLLICISG